MPGTSRMSVRVERARLRPTVNVTAPLASRPLTIRSPGPLSLEPVSAGREAGDSAGLVAGASSPYAGVANPADQAIAPSTDSARIARAALAAGPIMALRART